MRLRLFSDLHIELGPMSLPPFQADVVVVASDIHQGSNSISWIREQFPEQPVVFVAGNHELYHQTVPICFKRMREACRGTHVHFLEQDTVTLGGFTFLGCTLWADFCLFRQDRQVEAWAEAAGLMTDFGRIRLEPEGRLLRSKETLRWHEASRPWLESELPRHDPCRTIVVTHHAPSARSLAPQFRARLLNAADASNLEPLVERSGVRLWLHGHSRCKTLTLVTTLTDPVLWPGERLAALYARRWKIELYWDDIKTTLQMDLLRCQSPAMIHKELQRHFIAYNLIRSIMGEAALTGQVPLARLSFKGSLDAALEYSRAIDKIPVRHRHRRRTLYLEMLATIASDLVPERAGRREPRCQKRRPKNYPFMTRPRDQMKDAPKSWRHKKSSVA